MRQRQESKVMKDVIVKKQLEASQSLMLGFTQDLIGALLDIEIKAIEKKGGGEHLKVVRQNRDAVRSVFNNCKCTFQPCNPVEVTRGVLMDFSAIIDWVVSCVKGREFQKETIDWYWRNYFCGCYRDIEIGKTLVEELLREFN
jgi:hypothetical protein